MTKPGSPAADYADWRAVVREQLAGAPAAEALRFSTEGVECDSLCSATYPERQGPDPVPWSRPTGPPDGPLPWMMRQEYAQGTADELKDVLARDSANGVTGFRLRLEETWQRGKVGQEVTRPATGGARLSRARDWDRAFAEVALEDLSVMLDAGGSFLAGAAQLCGTFDRRELALDQASFVLGADPIGSWARQGLLPGPLDLLSDDLADLVRRSRREWQGAKVLGVDVQPYREAGAEIDQEVGLVLATTVDYLRRLESRGIPPEEVFAELTVVTSTGQQIFAEIAKLRALRVLWAKLQQALGADPQPLSLHASTLRRSLSAIERKTNLLRATAASWSAIVGGADSIGTLPYDASGTASASTRARRLARNTQLVLGHEGVLGQVADPAGGSYFLETLTRKVMERGWSHFQEIERRGGIIRVLQSGWLHESVEKRWLERRKGLEAGEIALTGVNVFRVGGDRGTESATPASPAVEPEREDNAGREPSASLAMPSGDRWQWCCKTVAEGRSLLEMNAALYREPGPGIEPFLPRRDSEPFES